MEKQKHGDTRYWITPGVFRGTFQVQHAVGQTAYVKKMQEGEETQEEKIRSLEEQLQHVTVELERYKQEWEQFQEAIEKEREHLYKVVLSLKQEWESGREG
ncbi:hypothetical protein LOK74_09650 [Brevibacillus humidisoli]|uniref:hypothetical protein n=1 Tax=Brevibacillus humidisoli TaxID=2895522 RepID=UPI001E550F98|nr:hypothetical protein [Brevibacillus humidisoli]UFJ42730.1 hypothetical protein LOK74_09650 [Brevibacillus humidisoli]